jgi:hypothetical protein
MSKVTAFLSADNTKYLISKLYQLDRSQPISYYATSVPQWQKLWPRLNEFDSYQSLVWDPITELEFINQEFIAAYSMRETDDYKIKNRLETPEDYWNFDNDTAKKSDIVHSSMYRFNNTIPLYQMTSSRPYDADPTGSGLRGRSIKQFCLSHGDMQSVMDAVDRPYRQIDDDDVPYYGQTVDDSSTTLINTRWKTDPISTARASNLN